MATEDPNYDYLLRRVDELEQLLRANPLRAASVSRGTTEFRDDSTLLITDSNMRVVGIAYVSGRLEGEGTFSWSGPALLDGSVEITNTLDVLAATRLRGETTIEGLTRLLSELIVEGKITSQKVRIEGGKIYVGEGTNEIVIDGATGQIIAGGMRINPGTNGGQIEFGNERTINAGSNYLGVYDGDRFVLFNADGVTIYAAGSTISAGAAGVRVNGPGGEAVLVDPNGIKFEGVTSLPSSDGIQSWYGKDENGYLAQVSASIGGPMGNLSWPFPPSMVTSEYGPRESPGEGASTFHEGIDFGASEGAPIPAAGPGVVEFSGESGGFGNCVIINHGSGVKTRYAHMQTTPYVSAGQTVARAQIIGPVGNTGISFGAHLHFEVEVNGVKVNPRTKLPAA